MTVEADLISRGLGATDADLGLTTPQEYRVYLRDRNYNIIDELKEWTSLRFIQRFNNIGTWQLQLSTLSLAARYIDEYSGIVIKHNVDSTLNTIFSGSISTQWEETYETISVAGNCDNELLLSTARPTPTLNEGPYLEEYYTITGIASTVLRSLVDANIGPSAPSGWKIPQLVTATDPLLGTTITARARFDQLLILLKELASTPGANGLGFKVLQSDTVASTLEFSIYEPRDLHAESVFSIDKQTARDYKRIYTRPSSNYFQVGGGDDFGLNRTVVEGGDDDNIALVGRRLPTFVDERGTTDVGELEQKLAEQIATVVVTDSISVIPADVPSLQYGPNYDLGDYVTAIVRGVEYARIITDIDIELSPSDGVIIIPTIADPFAQGEDDALVQHLQTLQNRIANIERNWNVPDDSIIQAMLHPYMKMLVGDIKITARTAAQTGWMICDGTVLSRTIYSELFSAIGTNFGVGDGSATFNLPDMRGRFPLGVGIPYFLGVSGGSFNLHISISQSHSHGLNNHIHPSQAHTHPGSHSHGLDAHRHAISHDHSAVASGSDLTGKRQNQSVGALGFNEPAASSGTFDHVHNIPAIVTNTTTQTGTVSADGVKSSGGAAFSSTQPDTSEPAAVYTGSPSGPSPSTTENDTNPIVGDVTVTPPYLVVNYEIFVGVG